MIRTVFKILVGIALSVVPFSLFAQISDHLHVDQFGYLNNAEKVAVISDPIIGFNGPDSYTPGSVLQVRDANSNATVFSAAPTLWNGGAFHSQSGDRGWWFDFSSFTTTGTYYVFDPSTGEQSATFEINANPYNDVMTAAGRMFFYNRCNFAKVSPFADSNWNDAAAFGNPGQDTQCRNIATPNDPSSARELSGGWYDAGDFNKYTTFTHRALPNLLWAYIENPQAFGDNWNIPESGNGIPDLIDEIKYELDWLMKMNDPLTGETLLKMGSANYFHNTQTPPSLNTDPRYYIGNCSSAATAAAAMFALSAKVFSGFPQYAAYATQLQNRAETTYSYVTNYINNNGYDLNCDWGQVISGDADWNQQDQVESLIVASVYLYEQTQNPSYNQYILNNIGATEQIQSGYWAGYRVALNDALLHYSTLPNANAGTAQSIQNALTNAANWNGQGFFGFDANDLYRASMPDWAHHWGSNQVKANFSILNTSVANYNLSNNVADYERKAAEQLHYFHGINPLGMVYLSNMYGYGGDRCVDEMYHQWFANGSVYDNVQNDPFGPAPGYLVGGPNKDYSGNLAPPSGEPILKSYAQFNDVPNISWEITEPAIYYNAAYIRHLANYVDSSITLANGPTDVELDVGCVVMFPNPVPGFFTIKGNFAPFTVEVLDANGNVLQTAGNTSYFSIDLQSLGAGMHFVEISDPVTGHCWLRHMIKP